MKIVLYNIGYGTGLKGSLQEYLTKFWHYLWAPKVTETVKKIGQFMKRQKADVICMLETDVGSLRNRFNCQAKLVAKKMAAPFIHTFSKYHPMSWVKWVPVIRHHHDAIISKIKGSVVPHYFNSGGKSLYLEFIVGDLSIFVVHLGLLRSSVRKKQMQEMTAVLKNCPRKYLMCGDFNIFKGLDEVADFIKENALKMVHNTATFPAFKPKRPIDLILACKDLKVKAAGVLNAPYSDHLPVWVEI